jgi:agmatinase
MFFDHDINDISELNKKITGLLTKNVYITIDLDVFDPSVMPSTGTPEPGGMTYYQVIDIIKDVISNSKLVGFDIVELCPNKINKSPDFMASKLIYQILSNQFNK